MLKITANIIALTVFSITLNTQLAHSQTVEYYAQPASHGYISSYQPAGQGYINSQQPAQTMPVGGNPATWGPALPGSNPATWGPALPGSNPATWGPPLEQSGYSYQGGINRSMGRQYAIESHGARADIRGGINAGVQGGVYVDPATGKVSGELTAGVEGVLEGTLGTFGQALGRRISGGKTIGIRF